MTSSSQNRAARSADEAADLVARMRVEVEAATRQIDELTEQLRGARVVVDDLETVLDHVFDLCDTLLVIVVDDGGTITGLSRGAAAKLERAAVGAPLGAALPEAAGEPGEATPLDAVGDIEGARVHRLPGGGALVVMPS
jgi:hypothetical protein